MDAESLRKAAILINALDAQTADRLLEQMTDEQAALVRRAVMELVDIDPVEQQQVIESFLASQRGDTPAASPADSDDSTPSYSSPTYSTPKSPPGYEGADRFAGNAADTEASFASDPRDSQPNASEPKAWFQFLHDVDSASVHAFLAAEHPQTVAIVLAHLPPRQAAQVLKRLSGEQKSHVIRRIATLQGANVDVLRDVEEELQRQFASHRFTDGDNGGLSSLQAILAAADDDSEREDWLQDIEQFDPEIAERLQRTPTSIREQDARFPRLADASHLPDVAAQPLETDNAATDERPSFKRVDWKAETAERASELELPHDPPLEPEAAEPPLPFQFDDLCQFSNEALASIMTQTPGQVVLIALAGAQRRFVERLMKQLPKKAAKSLNDRIEQVGPLRLKDVEVAQTKMVNVAVQMAADGKIEIPNFNRFAAAA